MPELGPNLIREDDAVYDYPQGENPGDLVGLEGLKPPKPEPTFTELLLENSPDIASKDIPVILSEFLEDSHFHRQTMRHRVVSDAVGLVRKRVGVKDETYLEKLKKEEDKTGLFEVSSVGTGDFNGQEAVIFCLHWNFFAGSMSTDAGENFHLATNVATDRRLPLVCVFSSSGVRQQEGTLGLFSMPAMVNDIDTYQAKTSQPYVAVLAGQVWGGVSASAVPKADLTIAYEGTKYGFAGPGVIAAYEGVAVEPGAQRVEKHAIKRNLDVVTSRDNMYDYVSGFLRATAKHPKVIEKEVIEDIQVADVEIEQTPQLSVSDEKAATLEQVDSGFTPVSGVGAAVLVRQRRLHMPKFHRRPEPEVLPSLSDDELYARYQSLKSDANRPDTEFLLKHVFDDGDYSLIGNSWRIGEVLHYPAIVAGVGRIATHRFMIIGNQPSYQRSWDKNMKKIPSSPAPADFRFQERMVKMAARLELPIAFWSDTLGAKPTIASEEEDTMREIANAMSVPQRHPYPVISTVIGALGSGGGLATTPFADKVSMLENSMAFVADPVSMAAILYPTKREPGQAPIPPTTEQVMDTLRTIKATAVEQKSLHIVDSVIAESEDPVLTALNLRNFILEAYEPIKHYKAADLLYTRGKHIRARQKAIAGLLLRTYDSRQ